MRRKDLVDTDILRRKDLVDTDTLRRKNLVDTYTSRRKIWWIPTLRAEKFGGRRNYWHLCVKHTKDYRRENGINYLPVYMTMLL